MLVLFVFFSDFSEDVFPLVLGVAYLWPEFICGSVDRVDGLPWARAFGEKGFPCGRVKPVLLVLVFGLFTLRAPASLSPGQVKLSVVFSFENLLTWHLVSACPQPQQYVGFDFNFSHGSFSLCAGRHSSLHSERQSWLSGCGELVWGCLIFLSFYKCLSINILT